MIDKAPETTTLECTLPKASVDRLVSIARQRSLTIDDVIHQAIEQSCERWLLEEQLGPAHVQDSAPDIPLKKGTPIEVKPGPPRRPDPLLLDDCESIPIELPRSPSTPIKVTKTVKRWPERLHDDA